MCGFRRLQSGPEGGLSHRRQKSSLAANKVPGIRAGVCSDCFTAKMVKEHNHCQIIAMGQRVVGTELAKMIVDNFFEAEELGGRHANRVEMITQIERDYGYADAPIK